jgi:predicted Fe-Mo cluster-binding NifX family protein
VDTVVCGGIDCWSAESLESAGIIIYSWVTGEIEDALVALVRGDLDSEDATEAGGRCGRKRVPDYDSMRDQDHGFEQEPIRGDGQGRRQRRGRRGGARRG